ncbi:MAG: hypothetical protein RDU25_03075 [Patescibacteria group bacterium]|nr:hypothetical protein [Patescibacteria group bacterium]
MLETIFDLQGLDMYSPLFKGKFPWEWIKVLEKYLYDGYKTSRVCHPVTGATLVEVSGPIHIGREVTLRSGAVIYGPAYIGDGCIIGHNALVREGCMLMGRNTIGHCSEVKRSILFPGAHLAHRNYVGDSVLGSEVNFGNGSCVANLLGNGSKEKTVRVMLEQDDSDLMPIDTGLRKFGALVGDRTRIGCNSVLNPGTILGEDSLVLSCVNVIGTHKAGSKLR